MKILGTLFSLFVAALPHINISMALVFLTLIVTDHFNRAMAFINNDITKGMLFVWCVLLIIQAVILVYRQRKDGK